MSPAFREEVEPALPIHNGVGWINVRYENGSEQKQVNLQTLFTDAHLIAEFSLPTATATAALMRVLISIAYDAYIEEASTGYWHEDKISLIEDNKGFSSEWVNNYFIQWEDRFYLIHPTFPFFQDPSLYHFYTHKDIAALPPLKQRKEWNNALSGISNLYPKAPSTANENGQKVTWGIPYDEVYDVNDSLENRTSILMTSLLHHRYSHSATNRGVRKFFDSPTHPETHHATHAFRCATHYIPQGASLYQTLLLNMKPYEQLDSDIPEWELPVNMETGFLGKTGFDIHYSERVLSFDAPRSSVNMTHLALLFVPEVDDNSSQKTDGGAVKQLRRLLFSFKEYTDENGKKIPFPITWNPFIALKAETGRALKQVTGTSPDTAMGQTNIKRVPLLPEVEGIISPEALVALNNESILEIIPKSKQNVNVYVYAGDASQDKTYSDFVLVENHYPAQTAIERENVAEWFALGGIIFYVLKISYSEVKNTTAPVDVELSNIFWPQYTELFQQAINKGFVSPKEFSKEIRAHVLNIFTTGLTAYQMNSPLKYASQFNLIKATLAKHLPNGEHK